MQPDHAVAPSYTIDLTGLEGLVVELDRRGYEVYGPQVKDGVIIHDRLEGIHELPRGLTDVQSGGHYRLSARNDEARFGYAVGPQSWKELLHPPRTRVWTMTRDERGELLVRMHEPPSTRRAFLGVRPCELAAILKQDRVLLKGPHPDPAYRANRHDVVLIAVNCGNPADTCFCTSMNTGPSAMPGYDIALTELVDGAEVSYVAKPGTTVGSEILEAIQTRSTTEDERQESRQVVLDAAASMSRRLDTEGIRELIYDSLEDDQWDEIAERCLTCGNCTLACPTCFCTNLEDVTDLSGDNSDRWRVWDSCFSLEFSHLGPGPERASTRSRYRQWFVHKLASWVDQFEESGCVGCGRCITWCPVGIDLTVELAKMQQRSRV